MYAIKALSSSNVLRVRCFVGETAGFHLLLYFIFFATKIFELATKFFEVVAN